MHGEHAGSLYVDDFILLPGAADPGYAGAVRDAVKRHALDLVMPITEAEIGVMPGVLGEPPLVSYVSPGRRAVEAGIDKLATARMLGELKLNPPWTVAVSEGLPVTYPCICKPRFGSGSRGVFTIQHEVEARHFARKFPASIFQELLEPALGEVTCAVYRTATGATGVIQMLRRLAGGLTGWARVIRDEEVERVCRAIAEALDLHGSINVQLKLTGTGPRIFEINPRFSSTALMRHRVGFRDVVWTLDELERRPVGLPSIPAGLTMVRTWSATTLQ